MPSTDAGQPNCSARARAAVRPSARESSNTRDSSDANPSAVSSKRPPHSDVTISANADDFDTTTGVPVASDSNAASPKVSCGPGATAASAEAKSAASSTRPSTNPRNSTGSPRARRSSPDRLGPSPAITSLTSVPESTNAATESMLRSTRFSTDRRPQCTSSRSASPCQGEREPSTLEPPIRRVGWNTSRSTPRGTSETLRAPIRSNSRRANAVVQTTVS